MAHFAEVDENNVVTRVLVVTNEEEHRGQEFLANDLGLGGTWIQTSYNSNIRNKFAGIGDIYDPVNDIFTIDETKGNYRSPWVGVTNPTTPSIMFDSVVRSGNNWTMAVINQAFPQAFQRWGYMHHHNFESFSKGLENFDATVTVVRNPIDSLASSIVAFKLDTDEKINDRIFEDKKMLIAVRNNKTNLLIFKFEDVINNTQQVTSAIGEVLNLTPQPFHAEPIRENLEQASDEFFYLMPIDNEVTLHNAKEKLKDIVFADSIAELTAIYNEIISN
jgi:hypothetical protein